MKDVQESYSTEMPTALSALNLFKDQWVSAVPGSNLGTVPLFQDSRVAWAIQQAGGMTGKKVLELGPLEGGHTYMFLKAGAQSVLGLEANTRCYLKCLVVKEALLLDNAHFLFGNFVPWLQENKLAFDFVHASGVLYHMVDPIELLDLLCTTSTQLYLWTHYADLDAMPTTDPRYIAGIIGVETSYAHGREYKLYRRHYQGSPTTDPKFCGGVHKNPAWLEKSMILHVLHQYGFSTTIEHDVAGHANGPCFSVLATKS